MPPEDPTPTAHAGAPPPEATAAGIRTLLICQSDAPLVHSGMARWLASWSNLVGLVLLEETPGRRWQRIRREARRIGWLRLLDVLAFRAYAKLFLAAEDARAARSTLDELHALYPTLETPPPRLTARSPNAPECAAFLEQHRPDIVIASCKHILKPRIFQIPRTGAFALHPGICPEYRNAHGCFWALARRDLENVGTTLLKIDAGIDTGPIYGYFRGPFDEVRESHLTIQRRMTLGNLDAIAATLREVHAGTARPLEVQGRSSAEWGQPWLSAYLRWKWAARARARRLRSG